MNPTDCQHFSTIDKINYHFSTKTLFQKNANTPPCNYFAKVYIVLRKPGGTKIAFSFTLFHKKGRMGVNDY